MKKCLECGETNVFEYEKTVLDIDIITFRCGSRYYIKGDCGCYLASQGDNCKIAVTKDLKERVTELEKQVKMLIELHSKPEQKGWLRFFHI